MQVYSFSSATLLNSDLAEQIKNILCEAIQLRGHAYLVVSGGKTPVELFKVLADKNLPWDKVTVLLADERCVAVDNTDSNERLVKEFLLQNKAAKAQFISLYDEQAIQTANMQHLETRIASLPTFDAVILGMGEDGHTASLFPCSEELGQGLDNNAKALLLVTPKKAPYQRISLSKQRLLNSHIVFIHLIGHRKWAVLQQAMTHVNPEMMPISAFLNDNKANVQVMFAPQ